MSEWAAKRFWEKAETADLGGQYTVLLDGREVRTPAKSKLLVPTRAMADAISEEWQDQKEKIDPLSMPMTRAANAAIDKVTAQRPEVADLLAAYGDSDLICYRASDPEGLVERQNRGWDPLVDWSATHLKAPLQVFVGVMYAAQPEGSIATLTERVHGFDPFRLTAFHDLVSLSGSLVLGFAVTEGFGEASDLWKLSRIDEDWQIEQWGRDEEADIQADLKRRSFLDAERFFQLCG